MYSFNGDISVFNGIGLRHIRGWKGFGYAHYNIIACTCTHAWRFYYQVWLLREATCILGNTYIQRTGCINMYTIIITIWNYAPNYNGCMNAHVVMHIVHRVSSSCPYLANVHVLCMYNTCTCIIDYHMCTCRPSYYELFPIFTDLSI